MNAQFFPPEILPWVSWCYGSHPVLWHPMMMGNLNSHASVQQDDPPWAHAVCFPPLMRMMNV